MEPRKLVAREPLGLNRPRRAQIAGKFSDPNSPGHENRHRTKSQQRSEHPARGFGSGRAGTFCSLRSISMESASRRSVELRLRMTAAAGRWSPEAGAVAVLRIERWNFWPEKKKKIAPRLMGGWIWKYRQGKTDADVEARICCGCHAR